jgi:hypothetical protein
MTVPQRFHTALDHLVIAATTLADGIDHLATIMGATPVPGGKHATMGTHNALLRLSEQTYLEIIAIDPDAPKPPWPRWFGLDDIALQADLSERPRLVGWVARTNDIEAAVAASPLSLGTVQPMQRGDYRWRIAIPDDGAPPGSGLVPMLIQWDVPTHPAAQLPKSNVTLAQLAGTHPEPAPLRAALAALGLEGTIAISYDRELRIAAMLRTPRGMVTL